MKFQKCTLTVNYFFDRPFSSELNFMQQLFENVKYLQVILQKYVTSNVKKLF